MANRNLLQSLGIPITTDRRFHDTPKPLGTRKPGGILPGGWKAIGKVRINGIEIKVGDQFAEEIKAISSSRKHAFVPLHSTDTTFIFDGAIALDESIDLFPGQPVTVQISRIRVQGTGEDLECQVDLELVSSEASLPAAAPTRIQPFHRSKNAMTIAPTASQAEVIELATQLLRTMREVTIQVNNYGTNHTIANGRIQIQRKDGIWVAEINHAYIQTLKAVTGSESCLAIVSNEVWEEPCIYHNCKLAMEGIGPESAPQDLIAAIRAGKVFKIVLANG